GALLPLEPTKKIVLAIDDDQGVLTLLKRYLENDGYEVVGVRESNQALSVARRLAAPGGEPQPAAGGAPTDGHLAAITLDIVMPRPGNGDPVHGAATEGQPPVEEGGWEILRALKKDAATKEVPVIVCSILEGLEKGLSMGAAACLRKPLTRSDLLATLQRIEAAREAEK
ncbi:MAG: hypothetical protein P8129_08445, partial [Anaerolineae bacterium]